MGAQTIDGFRLDGHLAVITGASRGLGEGCALALADALQQEACAEDLI